MSILTIELPPEIPPHEASLLLAMKLWETGRLSLGQAALLSGHSKRAFLEIAAKNGTPTFDYPPEDLEDDPAE